MHMPCACKQGPGHQSHAAGQNPTYNRGTSGNVGRHYKAPHTGLKGPLGVTPRCPTGMNRNRQGQCVPAPKLKGQR